MKTKLIKIEELFNQQLESGAKIIKHSNDYEVIEPVSECQILVDGNKYVPIKWLSRHKTTKHLIKIIIERALNTSFSDESGEEIFIPTQQREIIVTTDHVCMKYTTSHFFESVNAKNLNVHDYVKVYEESDNEEYLAAIKEIIDLGQTDDYVYDLEVEDNSHTFYANDILIHNSQFINLAAITNWLRQQKPDLPKHIHRWPKEWQYKLWDVTNDLVENKLNPFVRNMVTNYCHTSQSHVLTYELEYLSSIGIYEGKKHYATRKLFNEGDLVDKTKFAGIELKKASVPKTMKKFLSDIYQGVLEFDWEEQDYNSYISELYEKFHKFSIDEISFWKGYNTERQAIGFLKMQLGTTGIAKACIYYNQLIEKLGLGKKYEEIRLGDKVRFCYIREENEYGINCIAYKDGQYPKEFLDIFEVDYNKMFNKIILDPLKRFREACKFEDTDPSKQVIQDIFAL